MAIYELDESKITKVESITFEALDLKERGDIQRLLRAQIDVIADDVLVIAEEFNEWEGSKRSIDLLAVDRNANLVVIELKRTEDGGHMELQAIRYAAMVSNLTFKRAVEIFDKYLIAIGSNENPEKTLLSFFDWDEVDEDDFALQTRIILASADFSKEITSTVLWLNSQGMDISCVRMKPYSDMGRILLDVQTIIPLPETEQYQIKVREKKLEEQLAKARTTKDRTKYIVTINGEESEPLPKRRAMYQFVRFLIEKGHSPSQIAEFGNRSFDRFFAKVEGEVDSSDFIDAIMEGRANRIMPYYKRFYLKDDELFIVEGDTYAVTNQWGKSFMPTVESIFDNLEISGITLNAVG